ncbi:polyprotein [cosavirus A19]|uniref:Genome polyprotein n=1 Tax=cosavirus A19 TaxID=2757787 RepID=I1YLT7_9PICO|nr:polyprotein [cosavirus A19]
MGANNSKESVSSNGNEGTIGNNFYSNQYYASIDASAQGVGTSTTPENGNVSGFLGLAGSAFKALSLLASPQREKQNIQEDRIFTRNAGNTSVNSQASEGVLQAYGKESDNTDPTSCGDKPSRGTAATDRSFVIQLKGWTREQAAYDAQWVKLTQELRKEHKGNVFAKNLKTHTFVKAGYEVTLQINTSPFHTGMIGLFLVPKFTRMDLMTWAWQNFHRKLFFSLKVPNSMTPRVMVLPDLDTKVVLLIMADFTPEQFLLYPHHFINPKDTNIATVRVPYISVAPTNDSTVHTVWTAVVMVIAPLNYSNGASPTVGMVMTITPVNSVFNGLRHTAQGPIPTRPFHNLSQFNTTVPLITEPCYGMTLTPPTDYMPKPIEDLADLVRVPSFCTVPFRNTFRHKSFPYFAVSNGDPGTNVFMASVVLSDPHYQHTLLSNMAQYFCNYRGSLQFDFVAATTAMTRGKLLISYTPPGANQPESIDQAMMGTYSIWDLGLQSTFNFVVPFISACDFRYNTVSVSSALNSNGWISIWLMTPLTYPPNTPPTQQIVMMLSGGSDFTYRLPIPPNLKEVDSRGPPMDNMECGIVDDKDASVISGHSVALPTPHTNTGFFYDRYRFIGVVESTNRNGPKPANPIDGTSHKVKNLVTALGTSDTSRPYAMLSLSPVPSFCGTTLSAMLQAKANDSGKIMFLTAGDSQLYHCCPFTYIKCDLEFTVVPPMNFQSDYIVRWFPPGATIDTTQAMTGMSGGSGSIADDGITHSSGLFSYNPTFYARGNTKVSAVIPFCLPTSLLPLYFDGYPDYAKTPGLYGTSPASSFGTIYVESDTNQKFEVFIRYKNFKGYAPRPLIRTKHVPITSRRRMVTAGSTLPREMKLTKEERQVARMLLQISGDVESNPGPAFNPEYTAHGPVTELIQLARKPETVDNVNRLLTTLNTLMAKWNNLKETVSDAVFLRDMVCLLVKLTSLMYLVHGQGPGAYFAAASILLADGITFFDWYEKIKIFMARKLRVSPPFFPAAQGPDLRDFVTFFNAARGAQWMIDSLKSLITWIKQWLELEEENEAVQLEKMLIDSPRHCKAINDYNRGDSFQRPTNSFEFMDRLVECATKLGKVQIATYFRNFTTADSDTSRPEPVVVVLRGKPGAGKSAAATVMAAAVSKLLVGSQSVYTLSPDTEHMDGYHGQFVTLMDDLGQNPDGEDFRCFCQMVSCAQYRPAMADLKDKGILFTSRLLIATTNLPDFNPVTISDPRALDRRITFDILVTPGSAATKNGKLDLAAALKPDGPGEHPYTSDCPILHTTGLLLKNLRNNQTMNLKDLVDMIVKRIKHKKEVGNMLDSLVAQGPTMIVGYTKDDDGIAIVDCLEEWNKIKDKKKKQLALEMVAQELKDKHEEHKGIVKLLKMFVTGLGVVAAVAGAYATMKYFTKDKPKEEEEESEEKKEKKTEESKEAAGPYNGPTKKEIKTLKLKAQSPLMDMEKKIAQNVMPFQIFCNGKRYTQSCLAIGKRVILVNKHAFESVEHKFVVDQREYTLDQVTAISLDCGSGVTDVCAVCLPPGPDFKSIKKHFLPFNTTMFPGTRLTILSNDHYPMSREGSFLRFEDEVPTNVGNMPFVMLYKSNSYFGMCGSVVCSRFVDGGGIIGMHCAGGGGVSVGTRLTARMVESVFDYFYPPIAQGIIENTETGPRVHVPRTSKLKRTNATYPATDKYGPAALSRYDPRLNEGVNLDEVIFSKHTQNTLVEKGSTFRSALDMAAEIYGEKFRGNDFSPLSVEDAILGIPGLDRLDPNTASGLPYTKTRRQMIDFNTGQILDDTLKCRLGQWLAGRPPQEVHYQTFLKDEIRPIEKVKAGKTRIIDVPPLDHVIAFRMLFGRFIAHYHLNFGFKTGSAIGCDPDVAWASFGFELSGFPYLYDFDYSNFDASHSTSIFEILEQKFFSPELGFDPRCSLLLKSLAVSTHCYENKRLQIAGGLPSGTAGTSVLNTVINNIIFHGALYHTYTNFEWDDISMLAYGDDIVVASKFELDLVMVKAFMKRIGYKITPADKSDEFRPKCMDDICFLKRRFVKVAGVWAPVMETENLEAMLSWYKPGTLNEKLQSVSRLAHFSGRDVYDHLFKPFTRDGFDVTPWKQLHLEWLNKLSA